MNTHTTDIASNPDRPSHPLTHAIKNFGSRKIRSVWEDKAEKWYFSVVDVVAALTDSANPIDYIKKMRRRDPQLAEGWGQFVTPLLIDTPERRR